MKQPTIVPDLSHGDATGPSIDKPLPPPPPTLDGKPWTVATLKSLDSVAMRKLVRTYGAAQINAALQANGDR